MPINNRLLIIDDELPFYDAFVDAYASTYQIVTESTANLGVQKIEDGGWLAVILDLDMGLGYAHGVDHILRVGVKRAENRFPIIVVTSDTEKATENAVLAGGATAFLTKDFYSPDLLHSMLQKQTSASSVSSAPTQPVEEEVAFIGQSEKMKDIRRRLEVLARDRYWDHALLITGETGVGKDVAARYLHQCKEQKGLPFEDVNLSVFKGDLFRSELYGHVKGAFTGADRNKKGLFTLAERGTLFLDEIGEIDESTQVQLLKVLENRLYKPVGSTDDLKLEAHLIFATNRNLEEAVEEGSFRADFYERIKTYGVELPPLRERTEDIQPLIRYFIADLEHKTIADYKDLSDRFTSEVLELMEHYYWPNNIRELANTVRNLVFEAEVQGAGVIDAAMLPRSFIVQPGIPRTSTKVGAKSVALLTTERTRKHVQNSVVNWPLDKQLAYEELDHIEKALIKEGGRKEDAAKLLGLKNDQTLRYRVRKKYWTNYQDLFKFFPTICKAYKLKYSEE